jgi:hypothetical protein
LRSMGSLNMRCTGPIAAVTCLMLRHAIA